MTDEQIIKLARGVISLNYPAEDAEILSFAQLVATSVRNEVLEEAALVCESEYDNWDNDRPIRLCANGIRIRKS